MSQNLSFFHGVSVQNVDIGSRTISVPSSSIIGVTDTFTPGADLAVANKPVKITSEREAAQAFGAESQIFKSIKEIFDQSKAVISAVGVESTETANEQTSGIIGGISASGARTGLQAQLDAKSLLGIQPKILIAPGFTATQSVATAANVLANKLRAIAVIDGPNTNDDDAILYAQNFGSKRLYMVDPGIKIYNATAMADISRPASAVAAGLFAYTDSEYGFWSSPSNKEITGIVGTERPIEFLDNDETCRANLLNNANIATIIRDGGFRLWGNRTLSSDPKWAFVTRVRTVDIVMDAILAGHKWAVDRGITKTYVAEVTKGLNDFMRDLRTAGAVINFEAYPDPDLNTASQLSQGKVYWNIRFTDVPPAENPIFRVEVTDEWITEVLDINN